MALTHTSRFSVLKLEDDETIETKKSSSPTSQAQSSKNKGNVKTGTSENKGKSKKKKKCSNEIAELQNLAFGNPSSKSKNKSSGHSKAVQPSDKQWEEWKQKDSEFVSETYEQDLQEALLLSKIDYEEKKDIYDANQKETQQNKMSLNKKKRRNNPKKVKGVMSLDEFQNLNSNVLKPTRTDDDLELPLMPADPNFFDKIEEDAVKIISKEHKLDLLKAIDPTLESARLLQYQEDLRKKDEKISLLTESVKKLKEELKNVKSRNKKLYGILESGEMREKAEILVQMDELISVKDELTEQLKEYHTAVEQERSKVHFLQMELKKCKNKETK